MCPLYAPLVLTARLFVQRNLRDRHTFTKQDPYASVQLGKVTKKTEVDKRGGQHPVWYVSKARAYYTSWAPANKSSVILSGIVLDAGIWTCISPYQLLLRKKLEH